MNGFQLLKTIDRQASKGSEGADAYELIIETNAGRVVRGAVKELSTFGYVHLVTNDESNPDVYISTDQIAFVRPIWL